MHRVQVLAADAVGQATLTPVVALEIDGTPPTVKITRPSGGFGVTVRVSDPQSGVERGPATSVSFGDGSSARGRLRYAHRYAHAGVYRITVRSHDHLGNAGAVHRVVSVP